MRTMKYQISRLECCLNDNEFIAYLRDPQNFSWGSGPTTETYKFTLNDKTGQIGFWHEEKYPSPIQWYMEPQEQEKLYIPRFLGFSFNDESK